MGTRNLVCVVLDKQIRVAQYGQWDGYLTGQGQSVVDFLLFTLKVNTHVKPLKLFKAQVSKVKELTEDQVQAKWKEVGADDSGFVSMAIADKFKEKYPNLDRACGAGILDYVLAAKKPEVYLSTDFAADSLFCEWAYIVDLDNNRLEVYKGFNKEPLPKSQRFAKLGHKDGYYPIRCIKRVKFDKLTMDFMAKLEKKLHGGDE